MPEELLKTVAHQGENMLLQQPGGMFTVAGIERGILSTQVITHGLAAFLPAFANSTDDPRYGFWTGYGATEGSNPDYICDDAPAVSMKGGNLSTLYGLLQAGTHTIEATQLAKKARQSSSELQLYGAVLNQENNGLLPPASRIAQSNILNTVVAAEMVGVGVQFERMLTRLTWRGNPTNNTAHGGYKEFRGLDLLIKTGHVDVDASTAIPSVDSMIWDFDDYAQEGDNPTKDIVSEVARMAFMLQELADDIRMSPVTWAICMPRDLFFELTAQWACSYLTSGCGTLGSNITISGDSTVNMRWDMYNNRYLLINGQRFTVIVDDGIVKTAGDGTPPSTHWNSAIYFIPLTVLGRLPATHWEYVNYDEVMRDMSVLGVPSGVPSFWTDSGRFMWAYDGIYTCFKLKALTEPRIILRTPHLAGKIQGVWYQSSAQGRSGFPDEANYVGGGVATR